MKTTIQHLVIGGSGKTGARVIQGLKSMGYDPIGASRNGEAHFDWNAPYTWGPALNFVDSVYLTYYPDLAIPRAAEDISRFCALAKMKGVKHITLLSGRGEPAAQDCEDIVRQSGMSWTIVRAAWFNQNFSEGMFRQYIVDGKIALPVGEVAEPFIDIDDIAEVVLASLTQAGHSNQLYEVTGPELLSFSQLASRFSERLGRPIKFEQLGIDAFRSRLQVAQVETSAIEMLTYLFTEVLDGRNAFTADGVQRALGRPARNFDQFIVNNMPCFTEVA